MELIGLIIGVIGIIVTVVLYFHGKKEKVKAPEEPLDKENKALKAIYTFIGKSSLLKPEDVLGNRPFKEYYYQRDEDDSIDEGLKNRKNVLIVGPSLSGKTRAAYQALTKLNEPQDIAILRCKNINQETFQFPKNTQIIFIDDLHRFVEQQNFEHLFSTSIKNNVTIVATCRSEMEYKKVKNKMDLETTFENIVELPRISPEEGEKIANEVKINWDKVKFDKTVGSIFMPLEEMERRFINCTDEERTILRVLRKLYICGIYEENQVFPLEWIRTAAKKVGLEGKAYVWTGWLEKLGDKEFITLGKGDKVQAEEVYLEHIVKPPAEEKILDVFEEMITTFSVIPDALFRLGKRASDIGNIVLEKARYKKIATKAYEAALKDWKRDAFPMDYATTQNNLGAAYRTLAEVVNKAMNCKESINAYEEALKVYTRGRFLMLYATAQNNLGIAYRTLAEVEDKARNCMESIKVFEEALKVYTIDRSPMEYAVTQSSLGATFGTLAEVENRVENSKRAVNACGEALKVYTLDRFPMYYAMTQLNFGSANVRLAEVKDKAENCKVAIRAFGKALKIYTLDRYSVNYAKAQWGLGAAYGILAEEEDRAVNCKKGVEAIGEALKVFTEEKFPEVYPRIAGILRRLRDFMGDGGESSVGR